MTGPHYRPCSTFCYRHKKKVNKRQNETKPGRFLLKLPLLLIRSLTIELFQRVTSSAHRVAEELIGSCEWEWTLCYVEADCTFLSVPPATLASTTYLRLDLEGEKSLLCSFLLFLQLFVSRANAIPYFTNCPSAALALIPLVAAIVRDLL